MNHDEYNRLLELKDSINDDRANSAEKKEYMSLLLRNGSITQKQYDDFLSDHNAEAILKAALAIGTIILTSWLIGKLLEVPEQALG